MIAEGLSLYTQLAVCLMMTGVIWTVQLVIYPLFSVYNARSVHKENTESELMWLHENYTPRISYVVIPLMFSELGLSLFHAFKWPSLLGFIGLALVLGNWLCTFFISVPHHQKVAASGDLDSAKRLVSTNWPRTFLWSLRSVFLVYWVSQLQ